MTQLHDHDAHELPFDAGALLKAKQVQSSGDASASDELTDGRRDCLNVPPEALTEQDAAEYESAWFDATLDASGFFARAQVKPDEAALLLCGQDPHADEAKVRAKTATTEYTNPEDFLRLCMTFADFHETKPMHRSMLDWMLIADNAGRKFHPWARRYVKHRGLESQPKPECNETLGDAQATKPTVAEGASNAPVVPFKKAALIAAHAHEWPTIARDIADATANGLATAAKAGARGWREDAALMWARANGKLISVPKTAESLAQVMHQLGSLPGRRHTLKG